MKTYEGIEDIAPQFLTSALDRGGWTASHHGRWGNSQRYPLDRSLRGPQSRSRCCAEEKKSLDPVRNRTSAVQPIDRHYDRAIPAPVFQCSPFNVLFVLCASGESFFRGHPVRGGCSAIHNPHFVSFPYSGNNTTPQ
jgi:hypothetical protein